MYAMLNAVVILLSQIFENGLEPRGEYSATSPVIPFLAAFSRIFLHFPHFFSAILNFHPGFEHSVGQ